MVTGGTYRKAPFLDTPEKLDMFLDALFRVAEEFAWKLQAWAIMANHYHFISVHSGDAAVLRSLVGKLHMVTAKELNRRDATPSRRVWYQYWDSHISYQRSYMARLNYVHNNPVHHGIARVAAAYKWCSAAWFERSASPALRKTVASFKVDKLKVIDDF